MSKIICDVCGTRYPENAEQCPICGHIREAAGKTAADVLIMDEATHEHHEKVRGGRFSKSNVRKRTGQAVSYEAPAKPKTPKAEKEPKPVKKAECSGSYLLCHGLYLPQKHPQLAAGGRDSCTAGSNRLHFC